MLFLTLIAFFTFNTLNATSSSSRGFNYDMPRDYSGQMYTALLRCGACGQSDLDVNKIVEGYDDIE